MSKTHRYKVSGTVNFFVDDIFAKNPHKAREKVTENICDDVGYAGNNGNLEIVGELKAEDLGRCNIDKFYAKKGC